MRCVRRYATFRTDVRTVLVLFPGLALAACAGYRSEPPRSFSAEAPPTVHVIVHASQESVSGPARDCRPSLVPLAVVPGFSLYGQLLADVLVQLWADQGRNVAGRALADATGGYSLPGSFIGRLRGSDADTSWRIHGIEQAAFNEADTFGAARQILGVEPVEFVLFLKPTWFITRSLDELHLRVSVYVQQRPAYIDGDDAFARYSRQLEYVSESRGKLERDLDEGAKETVIAELNRDMESRVAARPGDEARLRRQYRELVDEIEKGRRLPLAVAAARAWPAATLHAELDRAADHVMHMLSTRFRDLANPDPDPGTPAVFTLLDSQCMEYAAEGERVGGYDGHTIYRAADGDLYSLPEVSRRQDAGVD